MPGELFVVWFCFYTAETADHCFVSGGKGHVEPGGKSQFAAFPGVLWHQATHSVEWPAFGNV